MTSLLFFDFETTGVDPDRDRIVSAAFLSLETAQVLDAVAVESFPTPWSFRVNPGVPIPAEATAVHGITDADAEWAPPFEDYAERVQELTEGATLVGYNSRRFDTILLHRELRLAGHEGLPTKDGRIDVPEIDLYRMWHELEPRTLAGAVSRFTGLTFTDRAHDAGNDTLILPLLLASMAERYAVGPDGWPELGGAPDDEVDREGKFKRDADGTVRVSFGKHKGQRVADVPRDYFQWMTSSDFPEETKAVCSTILSGGAP